MSLLSTESGIKLLDMFPLECIGSIKWNTDYASSLRALRGKTPRHIILKKLDEAGISISPEMMRKIEYGESKTISPEIFVGMCNAYEVHFSAIIPCVRIGIPSNISTVS